MSFSNCSACWSFISIGNWLVHNKIRFRELQIKSNKTVNNSQCSSMKSYGSHLPNCVYLLSRNLRRFCMVLFGLRALISTFCDMHKYTMFAFNFATFFENCWSVNVVLLNSLQVEKYCSDNPGAVFWLKNSPINYFVWQSNVQEKRQNI